MMKILILEDNRDRQNAMKVCLLDRLPQYEVVFFDDAPTMCSYLEAHLGDVLAISLDHDLEFKLARNGKAIDPGTGRDVVDQLVQETARCPVVVATTNSTAGDGMEFALREAHWNVRRVYPCGDFEWIPTQWFRAMRDAIVGSVLPRGVAVP